MEQLKTTAERLREKLVLKTIAERLREELDLKERANRDARNDRPPSDADDLTWTEMDIVKRVKWEGQKWVGDLLHEISRKENFLDKNARVPEVAMEKLRKLEEDASQKPTTPDYERAHKNLLWTQDNLEKFKREHNLSRDARIPDSLRSIVIMVAVMLAGGVANIFFLRQLGSNYDLLGALFQVIITSLANVGIAFLGGWIVLPQLSHRKSGHKLAGLAGILVVVAIVTMINVVAVQWMLVLGTTGPAQGAPRVFSGIDFFGTPRSITSIFWIPVGFLCAFVGAWVGYRMDDPYPGYGGMHQDVWAAQDIFDIETKKRDNQQRECKHATIKDMHDIREEQETLEIRLLENLSFCRAQKREAEEFLGEQLSMIARDLLMYYRDENQKSRKSESLALDPPAYFCNYPKREEFEMDAHDKKALGDQVASLETQTGGLRDKIYETVREVTKAENRVRVSV